MSQNPILLTFKSSCLQDLQDKLASLPDIQLKALHHINQQASTRIEYISKIFVDLEDAIVKMLREKIRRIFENQEKVINHQIMVIQREVEIKIESMTSELKGMCEKIEGERESKVVMGKIAQGKVEKNFEGFQQELYHLELPADPITYDEEQLKQYINEIVDLLPMKYKYKIEEYISAEESSSPYSQVATSNINSRVSKSFLTHKTKNNVRGRETPSGMANDSIISRMISEGEKIEQIQLENEDDEGAMNSHVMNNQSMDPSKRNPSIMVRKAGDNSSAIEEHKQTKTLKKMKKMQHKLKEEEAKKEKKQKNEKQLRTVAQLILQKQRLLKQLE